MPVYLLGIDNGGTYTKAVLFDSKGMEIACSSGQIPTLTPKSQYTERDMEQLWAENALTVRRVIEKAGIPPLDIKGVSFSGHGKGLYLWGKNEKPAYHGIMSTDGRAYEYPSRWEKDGTADCLFLKTCQKILACQPISLLKWFQENDPLVLENTRWIFGVKDYIRYRMTGEAFAELTDFSGSNLVNLKSSSYDREILTMLDLEEIWEKLPPLRISTDRCGYITKEAAELTGLAEGTPCAAGMFDIDACAIAMNITSDENIAVIAGTWGINEYISKEPVTNGSVMMNSLYCLPGFYLIEESSPTSAANHEWYINMFLKAEKDQCEKTGENIYALTDKLVESTAPSDATIIFLPYLFGSNYNSHAKASFIGIDSHHTQADIIRSIFEGVVFCHKVHLEKLLQNRPYTRAIRLSGGVCNSQVWVQIFADVFNMPIELIGIKELGAFGAALAAGVVSGCYKDLKSAAEDLVRVDRTVYPIQDNVDCYRKKYQLYKEISKVLEPLWKTF